MRRKLVAAMLVAGVGFFAMGFSSFATGETKLLGKIESSKVDIEVKDMDVTGEDAGSKVSVLSPGDELIRNLLLKNKGSDCYVRVGLLFDKGSGEDMAAELSDDGWILKEDGCFYYTKIFSELEEKEVELRLKIPEDSRPGIEINSKFNIDAIQAKNFTPDFSGKVPWGNVQVLEEEPREGGVYLNKMKSAEDVQALTVYYNEDAKSLICNFDDMFSSMPSLQPGDSYSEVIDLKNETGSTKTLFIKDTTDHSELLDYVKVDMESKIGGETKKLFSGSLSMAEKEDYIEVGTLGEGETGEFVMTVAMDEEAGNEASALSSHVSVTMEALDEGANGSTEGASGEMTPDGKDLHVKSAKTGDKDLPYFMFGIGAVLLMGAGLLYRISGEGKGE